MGIFTECGRCDVLGEKIKVLEVEIAHWKEAFKILHDVKKEREDEIERLREVLRECRSLLDDGVLVRDTTQDDMRVTFLRQGMRIAAFVSALNEALDND